LLEQPFWYSEIANADEWLLSEVLSQAYSYYCANDDGASADGHNDYDGCHGIAEDGRMVGSTTYYFGLAWDLDLDTTGNEVQTDTYVADLTFAVEQHRNNPNPFDN